MTNYDSIEVQNKDHNESDPLVGENSPPVEYVERPTSYKRYIAGPLVALCILGVGMHCSHYYGAPGPTAQNVKSWLFGNDIEYCYMGSENSCGTEQVCCPKSADYNSLTGLMGTCQSCCSNNDCLARIEQPPAGEFGKPLCIANQCQAYTNGEFSVIGEEGFPVYAPSETIDNSKTYRKYVLPRKVVTDDPSDPVFESLWYIDLNEQHESFNKDGVINNGTHITIPSYERLHAGYSKKYAPFSEEETGIVTLYMQDNKHSVVAQYPKLAFVEKYHSLTFKGDRDESRGKYVTEMSAQQVKEEPVFDFTGWLVAAYATAVALVRRGTITSQVHAGVDFAHTWQIRRFVDTYPESKVNSVNPSSSSSWTGHSIKAQNAIKLAKDPSFEREHVKSEQHCKHMELGRGAFTVDHTETTITIPLGRPVTIFSGEMVNAPSHYFGLNVGTVTTHYDEEKGILQMFLQGFSSTRQYADAAFPGPPGFAGMYLGPVAEGSDYDVSPKDGRYDALYSETPPEDHKTAFFRSSVPDLTMWRRALSDRCEQKTLEDDFWENVDITSSDNSIYDTLAQSTDMLKGIVRGMACSTSWMKPDYGYGSSNFDANEIGVWAHSLGEIRDDHTKEMTLAPWWDEWECFYQGKDVESCHY